jgi:hypothetical protein
MLFIVFLHLGAWATALFFAGRFVSRALGANRGGGALVLWLGVLLLVSFQLTTALRPILWRAPDARFLESGKRFFTDQLGRAADFVEPVDGVDGGSVHPTVIGAATSEAVSRVPDAGWRRSSPPSPPTWRWRQKAHVQMTVLASRRKSVAKRRATTRRKSAISRRPRISDSAS